MWNDTEKRNFAKSLLIPEQERERIKSCVLNNSNKTIWKQEDLSFAFHIYNNFIGYGGDKQDLNCMYCRIKVVTTLKTFVKLWDEDNDRKKGHSRTD